MEEQPSSPEITRRNALKRGAAIGAMVWATPVVSSIRLPARAQVGSPAPEPSPTPTPTTPPEPEPSPTPTPTPTTPPQPTTPPAAEPPEVGGSDTEVPGSGLAETGQDLIGQAIAGATITVIGAGMRFAARRSHAEDTDDDPPPRAS